ncbi:MAG: Fe-S protein assembly co-chaperone HscB [Bacteroidetes bacterium]|nr:Fe-S protein assembly co-chaperone HscB [Bacteroidota bacterium]
MEDYYAFYQLPETYYLDGTELKRRFMQRSRELHPDFHTQADAETQARNLQLSSLNNQAWRTLQDPRLRLQYLLQRYGLLDAEGANLSGIELDADFLMEVMDLNEALPEDPAGVQARVHELSGQVQQALDTVLRQFDSGADAAARTCALRMAMQPYLRLRYLQRLAQV